METLSLALLLFAAAPAAAPDPAGVRIHVLTMGPGDELFARFGHIALVVEDTGRDQRLVYNFGTFAFDDPDLQLEYLRGLLTYWLSVSSYEQILGWYRSADRQAELRSLSLSDQQAAEVAKRLSQNALPENRSYAYRHYLDNCSTRIRDLLDDVLAQGLSEGRRQNPTGRTFRDWTRAALVGLPLTGNVIDYLLGPAVDRPISRWEEYFLPEPFSLDLDTIRLGPEGRALVTERRTVLVRRGPPVGDRVDPAEWLWLAALVGLLGLGLVLPLALGRRRLARHLLGLGLFGWGALAGLGGLILALMWACTAHTDTHANENLLVTPLLHLWLLVPGCRLLWSGRLGERTGRVLFGYLVAALGLVILDAALKLGPFGQDNWRFIALASAVNGLALAALARAGLARRAPRGAA